MKSFKEFNLEAKKDPCWKGYTAIGMKKKNGKMVPNCVPENVVSEAIIHHTEENIPFSNCVFRYGSEKFFEFFVEARNLYREGLITLELSEEDIELLESDLGLFEFYDDKLVPLDFIFEEDENKELNKPKRGGSKKFYVYVRDPNTKNIKKISFGDTTGLTVKYDNPERKKAFAARHNCADKTDKTSAGYWACRINKYLGKTDAARSGYW